MAAGWVGMDCTEFTKHPSFLNKTNFNKKMLFQEIADIIIVEAQAVIDWPNIAAHETRENETHHLSPPPPPPLPPHCSTSEA